MFSDQDKSFMRLALEEANKSLIINEVPVGSVVVMDNEVVGSGHNAVISNNDISSHAEIIAIRNASKNLNNYRLNQAIIYTTLEPCHMCAKAIVDARIDKIIFATPEPKTGSLISIDNILDRLDFNHKVSYQHGLFAERAQCFLKIFLNKEERINRLIFP